MATSWFTNLLTAWWVLCSGSEWDSSTVAWDSMFVLWDDNDDPMPWYSNTNTGFATANNTSFKTNNNTSWYS